MPSGQSRVARRLNWSNLETQMKPVLVFTMLLILTACASQEEKPPTGPTKAEVKARDEFAKTLPKPPER
jgi:hypothetical protein